MNGLLVAASLIIGISISLFVPANGAPAVLLCMVLAAVAGYMIRHAESDRQFLMQVFVAGLLARVLVGTAIFALKMQEFFGGDAMTYDQGGNVLLQIWQGKMFPSDIMALLASSGAGGNNWGMFYLVAAIYALVGRNMLAVQFVNAVIGAATAPVVYLCAHHIFHNIKVSRIAAICVAFFPSLVLWSSQGLKDGPIIFLLAVAMLTTLKLGDKLSVKHCVALTCALLGILTSRFYVFYMVLAAVGGAFVIGMRPQTSQTLLRQFVIIVGMGLAMTYLGVLRTASSQLDMFTNLETIQRSRADLAQSAESGFGADVDVSTTSGALSVIPIGLTYLMFAPFPWQLENLRQSITLPEMVIWWCSFPLLVLGLWFTVKYRFRQSLPILIFTTMLTLSYSIFQGNVGTAYRQRAQLLIFYFIFVAVGAVLLKERSDDHRRQALAAKQAAREAARQAALTRRFSQNIQ